MGAFDVKYYSVGVGTLAGTAVIPLLKTDLNGGKTTILSAALIPSGSAAGTGIFRLVYIPGSVGTAEYGATDGTLCLFGSAANIGTGFRPLLGTAATVGTAIAAVVPAGKWVGLEFAGTCGGNSVVSLSYVQGVST